MMIMSQEHAVFKAKKQFEQVESTDTSRIHLAQG
jgi:hypothetical protein